ncbi:MAG TPA: zinc carboxypeptidase, partial [Saprospiraceae bacterium]|nr:zinc carboxypeptidase [Saprospiraceae bacterium]
MKRIFLFLAVLCNLAVYGQANDGSLKKKLSYYLPDISYNAKITSPEDFFGHQVGEWHISHDRLVEYMKLLADQSDRVDFVVYGRTHENRPLVNLHISSPQNLSKKNLIQQQSVELTLAEKAGQLDISKMPLIL